MKKINYSLMLIAAAAISFTACQKEVNDTSVVDPDAIQITVKAVPEEIKTEDGSKTYIDDNKTIRWGTGEYMKLALTAGEKTSFETSTDASADTFNGDPEAMFEFSVTPETASEYVYQGLYPASAAPTSNNDKAANYKVNLPAVQNATAASYDPAAYIMVAKPETFTSVQTDWEASFRRATALNKVTLKNVPSGVSFNKVKITATGKKLAGGRHFNLTAGEGLEVYGTDATIEVLYATPLTGTNVDVWFTSWDTEIAEDEKLTIVAYTTDSKSYTKEITVPAGKTISFKEGFLNTLGANLEGISPENVASLDGNYVILAENSGNYYALKGEASSSRIASVDYTGSTSSYAGDASIIWTIATSGSGYTIKNGGNFIGWTSGNTADLVAEASYDATQCLMGIDDNGDGTYKIYVAADATRILARNQQNAYFGFYTGSGYKDLVLVPATAMEQVATPTFNPAAGEVTSGTEVTISTTTSGATIYYTTDGTDPTTSSTQGNSVTITAATTVKAIAVKEGMANSDIATATYTVAGAETVNYVKVSSTPADWSGTYLIVSGTKAFNGAFSGASTNYGMPADVTVSDNKIESTTIVDAYAVTIAKSGSYYSIETVANGFLSWTSGNSLNHTTSVSGDNQHWSLTYSSGNVTIANAKDATRKLQYNSGSPRFACYTSSQQAVQLYKLESSTTPTPTTYSINIDNNIANGTVTASKTTGIAENEQITLTITPANNYALGTLTVDNVNVTSQVSSGTYSFSMPAHDVSVSATFTSTGGGGSTPTLQYTLDGTDSTQGSNGYATNSEITQSSIDWIAVANTSINPWRFGGKNLSGVDRAVYSTKAIASNISSIEVESGSATATVNSLTITVHNSAEDAASGSNAIATKSVSSGITSSTVTLTKTDATSWAGKYYRIVYNVNCGSSNQYVQFKSAKFYGTN